MQSYLQDNHIPSSDERTFTWLWQFDIENFIDSADILLGCYLANYSSIEEARENLIEHFEVNEKFHDLSVKALLLLEEIRESD